MGDSVSKEKRSEIMSRVRASGTKLEQAVADMFVARGLTDFVEQPPEIKGRPDFAFLEMRVLVFVDSCFWHGCPAHLRMPESNRDYWEKKIARNRRRDKRVRNTLKKEGWKVFRVWEHELPDAPSLKRKLTLLSRALEQD